MKNTSAVRSRIVESGVETGISFVGGPRDEEEEEESDILRSGVIKKGETGREDTEGHRRIERVIGLETSIFFFT